MSFYLALPLVQAIVCLVLGYLVIRSNRGSDVHRLFALFLLSLALWAALIFGMRSSSDIDHAYAWERWLPPLGLFTSVVMFHFAVRYTRLKVWPWVLILLYLCCIILVPLALLGFVFTGMQIKAYGYAPLHGPVSPVYFFLAFALPVATLITFLIKHKRSRDSTERNRLLYIIIGLFVALVGGAFDVLPTLGLPLYPGFIIGNLVLCVFTTVAILRHNLLDIRIVVRQGTKYFLTSAIVAAAFLVPLALIEYIRSQVAVPWWAYPLLVIVFALVMPPLWRAMQKRIDKWFNRDRYDTLRAMESLIKDTQSLTDSAALGSMFVQLVARVAKASSAHLLEPNGQSGDYHTTHSVPAGSGRSDTVLEGGSALVSWIARTGEMIDVRDVDAIPQLRQVDYREKQELARLGARLVVPVASPGGTLVALLVLGAKLSDQAYTLEDRQLIRAASSQMAIKLDNLRLYDHSVRTRENLQNLINGINDHIIILDLERKVQFMNRSAIDRFGDKLGEVCWAVLGKQSACPGCPLDLPMGVATTRLATPIGDLHYDVVITPLSNLDGSTSVIEVLRDMTERQRYEEELAKSYEALRKTWNDAISTISKIVEMRDPYTSGHQRRVAELATGIAAEMRLPGATVESVRTAAIIHDIGKVYVPSDILSKPGRLSDLELQIIRTHSQGGYDVVKSMDFPGAIAEAVLQHHERLDGSGYPNGLKGDQIVLEAKILAVADTVEAMMSHRPYRAALGKDVALEEIARNRGILYDPDVVDACIRLLKERSFAFEAAA